GHPVQFFGTHFNVSQARKMRDVVTVDRSHGSPLQSSNGFPVQSTGQPGTLGRPVWPPTSVDQA
ncbi:hypothetical protein SB776_37705, partial [Burkholderia sp. SIMBA_045]